MKSFKLEYCPEQNDENHILFQMHATDSACAGYETNKKFSYINKDEFVYIIKTCVDYEYYKKIWQDLHVLNRYDISALWDDDNECYCDSDTARLFIDSMVSLLKFCSVIEPFKGGIVKISKENDF